MCISNVKMCFCHRAKHLKHWIIFLQLQTFCLQIISVLSVSDIAGMYGMYTVLNADMLYTVRHSADWSITSQLRYVSHVHTRAARNCVSIQRLKIQVRCCYSSKTLHNTRHRLLEHSTIYKYYISRSQLIRTKISSTVRLQSACQPCWLYETVKVNIYSCWWHVLHVSLEAPLL